MKRLKYSLVIILIFILSGCVTKNSSVTTTNTSEHEADTDNILIPDADETLNFYVNKKKANILKDINYNKLLNDENNISNNEAISIIFNPVYFSQNFANITLNKFPKNKFTNLIMLESLSENLNRTIKNDKAEVTKIDYKHVSSNNNHSGLIRASTSYNNPSHDISVAAYLNSSLVGEDINGSSYPLFKGMYPGGRKLVSEYFNVTETLDNFNNTIKIRTDFKSKLKEIISKRSNNDLMIFNISYAFDSRLYKELLNYKINNKISFRHSKEDPQYIVNDENIILLFAIPNALDNNEYEIKAMEELSKKNRNVFFITSKEIEKEDRYKDINYIIIDSANGFLNIHQDIADSRLTNIELNTEIMSSFLTPVFVNIVSNVKNINPMLDKKNIIKLIHESKDKKRNLDVEKLYNGTVLDIVTKLNINIYNNCRNNEIINKNEKEQSILCKGRNENYLNDNLFDRFFDISEARFSKILKNSIIETKKETPVDNEVDKINVKIDSIKYLDNEMLIYYTKEFYSKMYKDITKKLISIDTRDRKYKIKEMELETQQGMGI